MTLDLSSPEGSFALYEKKGDKLKLLTVVHLPGKNSHSEAFVSVLDETLKAHKLTIKDLSLLITTEGPGSFTGLRIAYATLKGLAVALQIPIITISGSEARALDWLESNPAKVTDIFVLTLVGMGRFVSAHFQLTKDGLVRVGETIEESDKNLPSDKTILTDGKVKTLLPSAISWPLTARALGETVEKADSCRKHTTLQEWIDLSPGYFGSSRFE